MNDTEYRVLQDGMFVAGVIGGGYHSVMYYAVQYLEEGGPVIIQEKVKGRWKTIETLDVEEDDDD